MSIEQCYHLADSSSRDAINMCFIF